MGFFVDNRLEDVEGEGDVVDVVELDSCAAGAGLVEEEGVVSGAEAVGYDETSGTCSDWEAASGAEVGTGSGAGAVTGSGLISTVTFATSTDSSFVSVVSAVFKLLSVVVLGVDTLISDVVAVELSVDSSGDFFL